MATTLSLERKFRRYGVAYAVFYWWFCGYPCSMRINMHINLYLYPYVHVEYHPPTVHFIALYTVYTEFVADDNIALR